MNTKNKRKISLMVLRAIALVAGVSTRPAFSGALFAETLDTSSKVTDVVVFPDRALVTRQAELNLPAGVHEIKIGPLPAMIEEDSISAKGNGEAAVKLFGARLRTTQLEAPQSVRMKEIQEELDKIKDQEQAIANRKTVLSQKENFLNSIKVASSDQIGKDFITKQPSVTDVAEFLNLMDRELSSIFDQTQKMEVESRRLAAQKDRLSREWNSISSNAGGKQESAILVDIEAEEAGRFVLEVSYRLMGAAWQPVYEARAHSEGNQVELNSYGVVRQNTGEDWQDVTLHLSTAQPSIGGRMPEIQPWFLSKMEYYPAAPARATGGGLYQAALLDKESDELSEMRNVRRKPAKETRQAVVPQAQVQSKGPAVYYTLPKSETVKSDWQPKKVAVSTLNLPARLAFETTPQLSPYVYLRAKVTNESERFFSAGKVQIFLDGAYIGNSFLDVVGPREEFDLFLGVDERIKIERKQLHAKVDVPLIPGLSGREKVVDYEYVMTLENFRTAEAEIHVFDAIPVSQHDDIKVERTVLDPATNKEIADKPGVHEWTFKLPAGTKQQIRVAYRVKHPVSFQVAGI